MNMKMNIMSRVGSAAMLIALASASAAAAAAPGVVEHHIASMKAANLNAVMSDYAPDAVVVTPERMFSPSGVFVGARVRDLFAILTNAENAPSFKTIQTRFDRAGDGITVIHWIVFKGSPKQSSGHDVFVVRAGKIRFQSVIFDK